MRWLRLGSVLVFAACLDATAIDVRVYTEIDCAAQAPVALVVGHSLDDLATRLAQGVVSARATGCTTPGSPRGFVGDTVLSPAISRDETIAFAVMTREDAQSADLCGDPSQPVSVLSQCIVAKRSLGFVPHSTLEVEVDLQKSCVGKVCPSDQTCSGGVCVSACDHTETDPKNCGRCGHDCAGGACVAGQCQPQVVFTSAEVVPRVIVTDATSIYFTTADNAAKTYAIYRCEKASCPATLTPVIAGRAGDGTGLAVEGSSLYFTEKNTILTCPTTGCPLEPTTLTTMGVNLNRLIASQGQLYWTDYSASGQVASCSIAACTPNIIATNQLNAWGVGVDVGDVYWTTSTQTVGVYACPLTGCVGPPALITGAVSGAQEILSDGTNVYFTTDSPTDTHASSCPVSGCVGAPNVLASHAYVSPGLALDAGSVYLSGFDGNAQPALLRCAKTGCADGSAVLATNQPHILTIAVDDAVVYWTTAFVAFVSPPNQPMGGYVSFVAK